MRKELKPRKSQRRSSERGTPLHVWRRQHRPEILQLLVDHTKDLSWSSRLITLLLEELHVTDDFDSLVGPIDASRPEHYPRLVAIALLLRHSWYPDDLSNTALWLGLPSPITFSAALAASPAPATDGTVGSTNHNAPTARACTPQKGDSRC
jgi:hypothetical protein